MNIDIPDEFRCPVTLDAFHDPVILADGITYEREAVEKHFQFGKVTSLKTGLKLKNLNIIPNFALKGALALYLEERNQARLETQEQLKLNKEGNTVPLDEIADLEKENETLKCESMRNKRELHFLKQQKQLIECQRNEAVLLNLDYQDQIKKLKTQFNKSDHSLELEPFHNNSISN